MNDRELGRIGWVGVISIVAAFWFLLLMGGCAHEKPVLLWEMCRDKCSAEGAAVAAVIGHTTQPSRMACICAQPPEGT